MTLIYVIIHKARGDSLSEIIDLRSYPVKDVLDLLLADKTTHKNIIFATDAYASLGEEFGDDRQITPVLLLGIDSCVIQPRIAKALSEQQDRTRKKAEVFTPAWICNKMNNYCDEEWFDRPDVFNTENGKSWTVNEAPVAFDEKKNWQKYVDSRRLEITCGEAPYIVSRYDASTGESINIKNRIGILDRKLRIVGENTDNEKDWLKWTKRAFQSVYGYEYQGDNLLIARINLLVTFTEYLEELWHRPATLNELKTIANIISWNFWQMDGLTGTVPIGVPKNSMKQMSLFDTCSDEQDAPQRKECVIYNWRNSRERAITYNSMKRKDDEL